MRDILKAIRSGHWPSLLAAWLHFEVSFMAWLLVGALGVLIAEEFGLTATQKGLLVAVPLLGGAILRIPVGLLPPFAYAAPLTVAAVSAMGFGNGVVFQVAAGRFPKQMGAASGLIGAAGGLGGFLLPAWLGALKDATGTYQSGFLLFAALAGAAWISVFIVMRREETA